jgi:hypothetical protein
MSRPGDGRTHRVDPSSLLLARFRRLDAGNRRITFVRSDFRKGTETGIAGFETAEPRTVYEMSTSHRSGKILFGIRGTASVVLVDPDISDLRPAAELVLRHEFTENAHDRKNVLVSRRRIEILQRVYGAEG